jgi:L-ascorbate metabolism protein UlaG (beta-lactamase superfamily)
MRKYKLIAVAGVIALGVGFFSFGGGVYHTKASPLSSPATSEVNRMLEKIKWLGHASFKIAGPPVIYIDPWKLTDGEKADIILITHSHHDHCSPEDIAKIQKEDTIIVSTQDSAAKLKGTVKIIKPGDKIKIKDLEIEAVPAYNINKSFHPKDNGWVGYVISMAGVRIYHAGDTDLIPEMRDIKADIALLPVGGTYTMNAEEAARAANTIMPQVAIPMHYGTIIGSIKDAEKFRRHCKVEVRILTQSTP